MSFADEVTHFILRGSNLVVEARSRGRHEGHRQRGEAHPGARSVRSRTLPVRADEGLRLGDNDIERLAGRIEKEPSGPAEDPGKSSWRHGSAAPGAFSSNPNAAGDGFPRIALWRGCSSGAKAGTGTCERRADGVGKGTSEDVPFERLQAGSIAKGRGGILG